MLDQILGFVGELEEVFWAYMGAPGLIGIGLYLSIKSRFFQIRQLPAIIRIFKSFATQKTDDNSDTRGVAPIQAFFAAVGGAIGVGNLVSVCLAIKIGGPGAVLWMWFAALMGMLVKYGEIYLGVKFRVKNNENSYSGGPMMYLKHVPGGAFLSKFSAVLMCLYGIEIFIFRVVTTTVTIGWNLNQYAVIFGLLFLVVGVGQGGVRLVGKICSMVIPLFLAAYVSMGLYVIMQNITQIPAVLSLIFKHAFTPAAAVGAFAGSTMMLSVSHGVRRACYTGDIGIGYASTMHAETKESIPARQASLGIIDIFLDSFLVCTMSLMLVLVTGIWNQDIHENFMVATALAQYFPAVYYIWPLFIFLLGYTTLIAFYAAGRRAASTLSVQYGAPMYSFLATASLLLFSFTCTQTQCLSIMSIVGSLLLMCNLYGLFFLRDQIEFDVSAHEKTK